MNMHSTFKPEPLGKDYVTHMLTDPAGTPFAPIDTRLKSDPSEPETIAQFLHRTKWDTKFNLPTICVINGLPVSRSLWHVRCIADNDNVEFWSRPGDPAGGAAGSRGMSVSIGVVVAMVAATALLWWAAPVLAAGIGVSAGLITAVGGILIAGGGALLMQFLMPKAGAKAEAGQDTIFSIGASGNSASPMEPIPVGYGRRLVEPKFASEPYFEFIGNEMYGYELFVIGCGEYEREEVRVNDTPIWDSTDGPNPAFPNLQIEFYEPGQQVTLFPTNVVTASEVSGIALANTSFVGGFIVNAAGTLAKKLMIDLVWPNGSWVSYKDRILPPQTGIEIQYRPVDSAGAPTGAGTWTTLLNQAFQFAKQSAIRITLQFDVTPGRYEVRLRRTNAPISTPGSLPSTQQGTDDVQWQSVRAHLEGPQSYPDVTTMAIRYKADEAISGLNARRIATIQTRKLPIYDPNSGTFSAPTATRNPIDAVIDMWRNNVYSVGLEESLLDLETLATYAVFFDDQGYGFDHFFSSQVSIYEAIETALKVVKSHPAFVGDRLSLVRDEDQVVPRQFFTDREIVRGTLSIHRKLMDEEFADGVILQYYDESTWNLAEVGSNPVLTNPSYVQIDGVVQRAQAYDLCLHLAAVNRYRRRGVSFDVELEGRMLRRGQLVAVQSSVPRTWGASASVVSYVSGTRTMVFGNRVEWNVSGDHFIEVRTADGHLWGPVKVAKGASDKIAIVDATDLAAVQASQGLLTVALDRDDDMDAPSIAFSPGQPRSFRGLVHRATFKDRTCTLELVIEKQEVYNIDPSGVPTIPQWQLQHTVPSGVPFIQGVTARIIQRQLHLFLQVAVAPVPNATQYQVSYSADGKQTWRRMSPSPDPAQEHLISTSDDAWVTARAYTPTYGWGPETAPIEVAAPNLVLNENYVDQINILIANMEQAAQDFLVGEANIPGSIAAAKAAADDALHEAAGIVKGLQSDLILRAEGSHVSQFIGNTIDNILETVGRMQSDATHLKDGLTEAGFAITGPRAYFKTVAEVENRLNAVQLDLDATNARISLLATTVIEGDLNGLISSMTTAEIDIDALQAAITLRVTTATFGELVDTVTTVSSTLDAANAQITDLTAILIDGQIEDRLTVAETTISALTGNITDLIVDVQLGDTQQDIANLFTTLGDLTDIVNRRNQYAIQQIAIAKNSLTAKFNDQGEIMAENFLLLAVANSNTAAEITRVERAAITEFGVAAIADTRIAVNINTVGTPLQTTLVQYALNSTLFGTATPTSITTLINTGISASINTVGAALHDTFVQYALNTTLFGTATPQSITTIANTTISASINTVGAALQTTFVQYALLTTLFGTATPTTVQNVANTAISASINTVGGALHDTFVQYALNSTLFGSATPTTVTAAIDTRIATKISTPGDPLNDLISSTELSTTLSSYATTSGAGGIADTRIGVQLGSGGTIRADTDSSLSAYVGPSGSITTVLNTATARSDDASASGMFKLVAITAPGGVVARWQAGLRASVGGAVYAGGFMLDLVPDGAGGYFIIETHDVTAFRLVKNGTQIVVFDMDTTTGEILIPNLRVGTLHVTTIIPAGLISKRVAKGVKTTNTPSSWDATGTTGWSAWSNVPPDPAYADTTLTFTSVEQYSSINVRVAVDIALQANGGGTTSVELAIFVAGVQVDDVINQAANVGGGVAPTGLNFSSATDLTVTRSVRTTRPIIFDGLGTCTIELKWRWFSNNSGGNGKVAFRGGTFSAALTKG
jgi:hypothetical protein